MPIVDGYWRADGGASRQEILLRIEQLVDSVVDSLAHGQTPALPLPPAETRLHPVSRLLLHPASGQPRQLKATSRSFADVLSLCCSVYTLLSSRTRRTLRDIFYDGYGAGDADSQRRVDAAARLLCLTLGVHREQLNLVGRWWWWEDGRWCEGLRRP